MKQLRLGLAAAVLFGLIAFGDRNAQALPISTQSFTFDGTVADVDDPSNVTGLHLNDHVSGSVTFSPVANDPSHDIGFHTEFTETASFTLSGPATGPFDLASGNGLVTSTAIHGASTLDISVGDFGVTNYLQLDFGNGGSFVLQHLSQLPADGFDLGSLLGAGFTGQGSLSTADASILFSIRTPVAATPIPGAIWLFVSALGGLGITGWTRRRTTPAA